MTDLAPGEARNAMLRALTDKSNDAFTAIDMMDLVITDHTDSLIVRVDKLRDGVRDALIELDKELAFWSYPSMRRRLDELEGRNS